MQTIESRPYNILDSTAPVPRGKERMIPKKKKPKTFKRIINIEKASKNRSESKEEPSEAHDDSNHNNLEPTDENEQTSGAKRESEKTRDGDEDFLSEKFSMMDLKNELDALIEFILHPLYHREYVHQALTNQIEYTTYIVLINLIRFQDRIHHKRPDKLPIKRRYVCGFNQVKKSVRLNKAKAVIIAPDIQKIINNGILDQTVNNLITLCSEKEIPVIFTSKRNHLAKVCCKNPQSNLSCIAILDYSGTQEEFHRLIDAVDAAKEIYQINRISLKKYLENLSEASLLEIYKFIKENNQIPESLQIYREAIYSPLQRNIYCYIKLIKQQK